MAVRTWGARIALSIVAASAGVAAGLWLRPPTRLVELLAGDRLWAHLITGLAMFMLMLVLFAGIGFLHLFLETKGRRLAEGPAGSSASAMEREEQLWRAHDRVLTDLAVINQTLVDLVGNAEDMNYRVESVEARQVRATADPGGEKT